VTEDVGGCDGRYHAATCVWGVEPDPILAELATLVPLRGVQVLDAGCGEGRHADYLARQGARVRASDVSQLAVDRARRMFPDGGSVEWACADLRTMDVPASSLGGVLLVSVLHWLRDVAEVRAVVDRLQAATWPGGWHVLSVFNAREPYVRTSVDTREPCLLDHDWFLRRYTGWNLATVRDFNLTHAHAGHEETHTHAITELIALRPGTARR
jgi:2-polyprenyl-3-methyl-5-hydroxy-6-metoxy-1,4-benzoquinol methylase